MENMLTAVQRYCEKKGITVAEFERICGFGHNTVRKWDRFNPTLTNVQKMANATGVSVITWIKEAQKETA